MAKQLNKNMVVGLTIVGMLLMTAAGVVMILNLPKTDPQPVAAQALEAVGKGEFEQATKLYQKAAFRARSGGADPSPYLIKAGETALKGGDARLALDMWQNVILSNPEDLAAHEKIVSFLSDFAEMGGRWADLQAKAQALCEVSEKTGKKSYMGLHALGRALIEQRAIKEENAELGRQKLIEAVEGDKSNPVYARSLANSFEAASRQAAKKPTEAAALVDKAVGVYDVLIANPSDDVEKQAKAYLYRGQLYASEVIKLLKPELATKAAADLEKAVALAPKNVDVLNGVGAYWHSEKLAAVRRGAPKEEVDGYRAKARKYYKDAIEADYDHYEGYLRLAGLYQEDKEYDAALQTLRERMARGIKREHYLGWRSRHYMSIVRNAAFEVNFGKLATLNNNKPEDAAVTEGILADMDKLYKESVAELQGGEQEPSNLVMQGRLAMIRQKPYDAIKAFEQVDKLMGGNNLDVKKRLASLYLDTRSPDLAEKELTRILSAAPNEPSVIVLLAQTKLMTGRLDEALADASRALSLEPGNTMALGVQAEAYRLQKNWTAYADIVKKIAPAAGTGQDKLIQAGLLLAQAEDPENPQPALLAQAEQLLRESLAVDPLNPNTLMGLVNILSKTPERPGEATKVLAEAKAALEKKRTAAAQSTQPAKEAEEIASIQSALDQIAISADPNASAEEKNKRMEDLIRRNPDPLTVQLGLANLYRRTGRHAELVKAIQEAIRLKPEMAALYDHLFRAALAVKDWKLAEDTIPRLVELNAAPGGGHLHRGQLLFARTDVPNNYLEAAREFRAGLEQIPSYAEGYVLLGQALLGAGQQDEAEQAFHAAMQRNRQLPIAAVGLAVIAGNKGDDAEYRKYLEISSRLAPQHPWVKNELQNQLDTSDPKRGITRREAILQADPKNADNLLRLADLYRRESRFDDAKKAYETLMQLTPADLGVCRLYANLLTSKEPPEPQAAREFLQKTVRQIESKDADRKAEAQLLLGEQLLTQARMRVTNAPLIQDVDAAYVAAADFSKSASVLLRIGSYFSTTARNDQAEDWFRKAITAAQGPQAKEVQRRARRQLIEAYLNEGGSRRADELQKAIDEYRTTFPEDPMALLYQAELYSSNGRDAEAMEYFNDFVEKDSDPLLAYMQRGMASFRRSQWEPAIKDLREVKRRNPAFSNYRGWQMLALALENAGEIDSAISELQGLLSETNAPQIAQQLFGVYKKLQRWDSAESLIASRSQAQPDNPTWDMLRLDLAKSRNQPEAAIAHAQRLVEKTKMDPTAVDALLQLYLQVGRFDDVIQFVKTRIPSHQQTAGVHARVASAHAGKKDVPAAVAAYIAAYEAPDRQYTGIATALDADLARRLDRAAALDAVQKQIQAHPQQRSAKMLLAQLHRRDPEAYIADLKELLAGVQGNEAAAAQEKVYLLRELAVAMFNAGKANPADKGRMQDARKYYEQVLEINPDDVLSLNNLAYLLMDDLKDPQAALPYARRVVAIVPGNPGVIDTLGWNLVLLGNYDEGVARLRQAIEKDATLASLHYHLAEAFFRRGSTPEAKSKEADLKEARDECQRAYDVIAKKKVDDESILDQVLALGKQLGLNLDPGVVKPATSTASRQ